MAEVYWIHLPEHTDMFTTGYIGVTGRTTQERFKEHLYCLNRENKNHRFYNALSKYKDVVIVDTICICSEEYAYELEFKLRPEKNIGWNANWGGEKPPGVKGLPVSEETRRKLSIANKGRIPSPESIRKMADSLRGRKLSEDHRRKISLGGIGKKNPRKEGQQDKIIAGYKLWKSELDWWEINPTTFSVGIIQFALSIEKMYLQYPKATVREYCEAINIPYEVQVERLVKRMKQGWFPSKSQRWLDRFGDNILEINHNLLRLSMLSRKPWLNPKTDRKVWALACEFKLLLEEFPVEDVSKHYFNRTDKLDSLKFYLDNGWNPSDDTEYLNWSEEYRRNNARN